MFKTEKNPEISCLYGCIPFAQIQNEDEKRRACLLFIAVAKRSWAAHIKTCPNKTLIQT